MGLGEFFAWIERESPGEDAQRVVRIFLAEVGSEPWRAPSTPIPDLSAQPDYEVRTAELDLLGWVSRAGLVPPHLRDQAGRGDRRDRPLSQEIDLLT